MKRCAGAIPGNKSNLVDVWRFVCPSRIISTLILVRIKCAQIKLSNSRTRGKHSSIVLSLVVHLWFFFSWSPSTSDRFHRGGIHIWPEQFLPDEQKPQMLIHKYVCVCVRFIEWRAWLVSGFNNRILISRKGFQDVKLN